MENPINRQPFEPGSKIVSTYQYTLNEVLQILNNSKSSVVANRSTKFTIPPRLSEEFYQIAHALGIDIKPPTIATLKMVT